MLKTAKEFMNEHLRDCGLIHMNAHVLIEK